MSAQEWLNQRDHGAGIFELQLGHGPDNSWTAEFLTGFAEAITELSQRAEVRVILLSSPFRAFSTGLNRADAQTYTPEQQISLRRALNTAFLTLYACPKPTIAVVGGDAIGGGLFFALASDMRIGKIRTSLGLTEMTLGTVLPAGLLELARATLDTNVQRRMILSGQTLGPVAARNYGIIDIIADDDEDLWLFALQEAQKFARLPAQTFAAMKNQLRSEAISRIKAAIESEETESPAWFSEETPAALRTIWD